MPLPPGLQILGLTATPTSKDSLAATLAGMRELARNLAAEYVVVDEKDEELLVSLGSKKLRLRLVQAAGQQAICYRYSSGGRQLMVYTHASSTHTISISPLQRAVPNIEQAEVVVQLEAADDGFARRLGAFVVAAVERLREGLGLPGG